MEFTTGSTEDPSDLVSLATSGAGSYGRRVLTLYEYLEDLSAEYHQDKQLSAKLKEVIKMVLALNAE